jgi:hypothetical protein
VAPLPRHIILSKASNAAAISACRCPSAHSCSLFLNLLRHQCFGKEGIEQATAGVVAGGEARLQPVTQGHQFSDLGDDAALFGEGWEPHHMPVEITKVRAADAARLAGRRKMRKNEK